MRIQMFLIISLYTTYLYYFVQRNNFLFKLQNNYSTFYQKIQIGETNELYERTLKVKRNSKYKKQEPTKKH
jgi:hypothetical protein